MSAGDYAARQPRERKEEIDTIFDTKDLAHFIDDVVDEGVIDASVLETQALELQLDADELALLRSELEARGVEITATDESADALELDPAEEPDGHVKTLMLPAAA